MKIIERIYNAETDELVDFERVLSAEELKQYENDLAEANVLAAAIKTEQKKREEALKKLQELGLSEEDLKALGL